MAHNLFPLPYWAPAPWRVPMPLQLATEDHRWDCQCTIDKAKADGLIALRPAPAPLALRPTFYRQRERRQ